MVEVPRGNYFLGNQIVMSSAQGAGIRGHGRHVTTLIRNFSQVASGIYSEIYDGLLFEDFALVNLSPTRGDSYGLTFNPTGGGGNLTVQRVLVQGFKYGAFIAGDIITGNGDKSLWSQFTSINDWGWTNGVDRGDPNLPRGGNKQAIGHTFINPDGGCEHAFYLYGGSGSTITLNGTINVFGALLNIPEYAGTLQGGMFAMYGTKTEYHGEGLLGITAGNAIDGDDAGTAISDDDIEGATITGVTSGAQAIARPNSTRSVLSGEWAASTRVGMLAIWGDTKAFTPGEVLQFHKGATQVGSATVTTTQTLSNLLVDASGSVLHFDGQGSAVFLGFDKVWHTGGPNDPQNDTRPVMKVGDGVGGTDRIIVQMRGSYCRGSIDIASAHNTRFAETNQWVFDDNVFAPDPAQVKFQGVGSHMLMRWRGNHNVPVDQYRGGQSYRGAIDAEKAYLWRSLGPAILNTGVNARTGVQDIDPGPGTVNVNFGPRFGDVFEIQLPPATHQRGLMVYVDKPFAGGDLEVTQYTDGTYITPVGGTLALPDGTVKGGYEVHSVRRNLANGKVYLKITGNLQAFTYRGAVVPLYFPYMGS